MKKINKYPALQKSMLFIILCSEQDLKSIFQQQIFLQNVGSKIYLNKNLDPDVLLSLIRKKTKVAWMSYTDGKESVLAPLIL
jgi:hypothetical protein